MVKIVKINKQEKSGVKSLRISKPIAKRLHRNSSNTTLHTRTTNSAVSQKQLKKLIITNRKRRNMQITLKKII